MNVACGTDIIEISRVRKSIEEYEDKFKTEIFTPVEVNYCEGHKAQKYQHYAVRFAAKEAIFKAISTKLNTSYEWTDFEVVNTETGKPEVVLKTDIPEIANIDISLSHCKEYAVATAVVLFN